MGQEGSVRHFGEFDFTRCSLLISGVVVGNGRKIVVSKKGLKLQELADRLRREEAAAHRLLPPQ